MGLTNPLMCSYPDQKYKPQFAYPTPAPFRDELFLVPFRFLVMADGKLYQDLPWRLDDDANYCIRGIIFPAIGTAQAGYANPLIAKTAFPGLVRVWDTQGNPLSNGLVLALGVWGQSGLNVSPGTNAFGFPVEDAVWCNAGGSVLFDFQLQTDAAPAFFTWTVAGTTVVFASSKYGTIGNASTITIVNPGAPNIPLSVAVVGAAVTVTLATNGASAITSTLAGVAAAVNASTDANAVMWAVVTAGGAATATALAITNLAGGTAATGAPVEVTGTLIGVKRFKDC